MITPPPPPSPLVAFLRSSRPIQALTRFPSRADILLPLPPLARTNRPQRYVIGEIVLKDMSIHLSAAVWRDLTSAALEWDGALAVRELVRKAGLCRPPRYREWRTTRGSRLAMWSPALPPPLTFFFIHPPRRAWSVKTRRALSRLCRDARIYHLENTAMHDNGRTPSPAPEALICACCSVSGGDAKNER